jgi:hypothetical protein
MDSTTEGRASENRVECDQCGKPAIINYAGRIPLCADCYYKVAQANFMEQQTIHNKLSWAASNLNFLEQELYVGHGGLLPLKQIQIPQPPSSSSYSFNQIRVSKSNVGVINTGILYNLDTSIQVMQNSGDKELADAVRELTQAVLDSEIDDELKREISEQLEFLVTEALASKDKQRKSLIKTVIDKVSQSIATVGALLTIWSKLEPLLRAHFGL